MPCMFRAFPVIPAGQKKKSNSFAKVVAEPCGSHLTIHTVEEDAGAGIKELANLIKRPTCSAWHD